MRPCAFPRGRRGQRSKNLSWMMFSLLLVCLSAAGAGAAETDPEATGLTAAERIEIIVSQVEERRAGLESLRAKFRERKESPLLLEAEDASGEFVFVAPDRARWDLGGGPSSADDAAATDTVVVVTGDEMLTWFRHLGTAERVKLGSQGERLLQFFGPGSSLDALRRYFNLRFTRSADPDVPYRMELMPRSRRVARRIRHLTLDIDRQLFLPIYVRFEEAAGSVTEYWFSELESNVDIAPETFDLQLPADVEVRDVEIGRSGERR